MNPIQKALALRRSLPAKAREPDTAFSRRLYRPREILNCVEKHSSINGVLYEARRQYMVSLCAAYEAYWRDFLKTMVDSHRMPPRHMQKLRQHKFSFSDLQEIVGNQLTLGELLTCSYTFQSTDVINLFCGEVFDFDFFGAFRKAKFTIRPVYKKDQQRIKPTTIEAAPVLKCRESIDRCFKIRHETVHDTGTRYHVSRARLRRMESDMRSFNLFGSLVLQSELEKIFANDGGCGERRGKGNGTDC